MTGQAARSNIHKVVRTISPIEVTIIKCIHPTERDVVTGSWYVLDKKRWKLVGIADQQVQWAERAINIVHGTKDITL